MKHRDPRPSEEHIRRVHEMNEYLVPALREVARQHGYALATHGSLERDIDLIAVPWSDHATSADSLIDAVFAVTKAVHSSASWSAGREAKPEAERKPHGRLAWSILTGSGPYLDISIMAPTPKVESAPAPRKRKKAKRSRTSGGRPCNPARPRPRRCPTRSGLRRSA